MMAMLITMIGLVGLLKSLELGMGHNVRNQLRDEAVMLGEQTMSFQKVRSFDQLTSSHPPLINSRIRSGALQYQVECTTDPTPPAPAVATDKLITVTVTWNYKGTQYRHQVRSIRSR